EPARVANPASRGACSTSRVVRHKKKTDDGRLTVSDTLPIGAEVPRIDPNDLFTLASLAATIPGWTTNTAKREIRAGRLRAARRGGRLFVLGEWVREYFRAGEVIRKPRAAPAQRGD